MIIPIGNIVFYVFDNCENMLFHKEYTLLYELGKGGFATVYKVRQNELGYIRTMRVLNETIAVKTGIWF